MIFYFLFYFDKVLFRLVILALSCFAYPISIIAPSFFKKSFLSFIHVVSFYFDLSRFLYARKLYLFTFSIKHFKEIY